MYIENKVEISNKKIYITDLPLYNNKDIEFIHKTRANNRIKSQTLKKI